MSVRVFDEVCFSFCNCCYDNWNSLFFSHSHNSHYQGDKFLQHTNTTMFMATKPGRTLNYFDWLPTIKLLNNLITWSCKIIRQTKASITVPMTTNFERIVTHHDELLPIKSNDPFLNDLPESKVLLDHVMNSRHISTPTKPMNSKPYKVVAYNEDLPLIKHMVTSGHRAI